MKNKSIAQTLKTFYAATALLGVAASTVQAQVPQRPNIILVYADDISARELPVYGSTVWSKPQGGDTTDPAYRAKTPVLDQMAQQGCYVKNAWAAVICSPARAMMMTGRYAHLHKWWFNGDYGKFINANGQPETWPLFDSSPRLIGHMAQTAGYGTFWAGKTQMAHVENYGFDEGAFTPGEGSGDDNPFTDFRLKNKKVDGENVLINTDTGEAATSYAQNGWYWKPFVSLMNAPDSKETFTWWPNTPQSKKDYGLNTYGPDVELDFIFDYMERQTAQKKPFFIYHTSHLGHDGFDWLNPASTSKWPGTPVIKWNGTGYTRTQPNVTGDKGVYDTHGTVTGTGIHNHVNYLDYQMWLYRNKLKELGIEKNTVVIFCADNGTWGFGKGNVVRQRGTQVPLIIYAPGMTKHGAQDVLADMSDMLPTIAELTGTPMPAGYEANGESLVPFLMTDKPKHRSWIYSYSGANQMIRGEKVLKDGKDNWWDVSKTPDDLDSFPRITDWDKMSAAHRAERDRLQAILPRFDWHETAHDAPGFSREKAASSKKNKARKADGDEA